jgi:hypothetical protein
MREEGEKNKHVKFDPARMKRAEKLPTGDTRQ